MWPDPAKLVLSHTLANDHEENIFLFILFYYNCVVFSKKIQIAFLNFKCHFHKKTPQFQTSYFSEFVGSFFGVKHPTELCDIPN